MTTDINTTPQINIELHIKSILHINRTSLNLTQHYTLTQQHKLTQHQTLTQHHRLRQYQILRQDHTLTQHYT